MGPWMIWPATPVGSSLGTSSLGMSSLDTSSLGVSWEWPVGIAAVSVVLGALAWGLVASRDVRDPARDIRHPWQVSWRTLRLPVEALIVGVSFALSLWWAQLAELFDYGPLTPAQVLVVLATVCVIGSVTVTFLVLVRSGQRLLLVAVLGMLAWAVAAQAAIVSSVEGRPPVWSLAVLVGVVPLVVAGLSTYRPRPNEGSPASMDHAEHRDTRASTWATGIALCIVLIGLPFDVTPDAEPMSNLLVVLLVVLFALREAVNAYFRVQLTRRLHYQAVHDQLTGLPNRRGLSQVLLATGPGTPWVVIVLDLDGFKRVNDELGYQSGDRLLVAVAEKLAAHAPPPRTVARLGGDEFAVLSPGDLESGRRLALHLRGAVREAVDEYAPSLPVTSSIGVGRLPVEARGTLLGQDDTGGSDDPGQEAHRTFGAVSEASAALRAAKAQGKDRIEIYAGRTERGRRRRLALERRLHRALETDAVAVHLQPIVRLVPDSPVHGFEALARWTDPELGPVPPAEFITVAEQTGLIVPLGEAMFRRTIREVAQHGFFDTDLRLSINVSPLQLRAPGFVEGVLRAVDEYGADPRQITIELTEAVLIDEDQALGVLTELTGAGLGLAIDDFGTGHAALSYLRRLPFDVLKIDRSLTVGAVADRRSRAVVTGMIRLARTLDIEVVMEGVEDARIAAFCQELGAGLGQGWFYGRARSLADAGSLEHLIGLTGAGRPDAEHAS